MRKIKLMQKYANELFNFYNGPALIYNGSALMEQYVLGRRKRRKVLPKNGKTKTAFDQKTLTAAVKRFQWCWPAHRLRACQLGITG